MSNIRRYRVRRGKFKENLQGKFSSTRVIGAQNMRAAEMVETDAIATFKKHLDRHVNKQLMERYGP